MLKNLNYTQKNKLLLLAIGIGLLVCWFFAFSKTFDAIRLYGSLNTKPDLKGKDLSFNPQHAQRKLNALKGIIKGYVIRESQCRNELWFKGSSIAAKENVSIDYTLEAAPLERDSTTVGIDQTMYFYGGYIPLVKLVDSLERTPLIGKISALQIKAPLKDLLTNRKDKCVLKVEFKGIEEGSNP